MLKGNHQAKSLANVLDVNLYPEYTFLVKRCGRKVLVQTLWVQRDSRAVKIGSDRTKTFWLWFDRSLDSSLCFLYHRFSWQVVQVRTFDLNICTACELGELFPPNKSFHQHKHPDGLFQLPLTRHYVNMFLISFKIFSLNFSSPIAQCGWRAPISVIPAGTFGWEICKAARWDHESDRMFIC